VLSKPCVDRQSAGQRTSNAVREYRVNDLCGPTGIVVIQDGGEHIP
jgi:hypothetical protein